MNKFKIILFIFFALACSSKNAKFSNYDLVRKNELRLNEKADTALNEITKLLDGGNLLIKSYNDGDLPAVQQNEIFFNLTEKNRNIYLRLTLYKDFAMTKISGYREYEIPIEEIDPTSFNVTESFMPSHGGNFAFFEFNSKYNNDSFTYRGRGINKKNEMEIGTVSKTSNCNLTLKIDIAHKLKNQMTIFIKNL